MAQRTTIVLDEESRAAANDLSRHYGCSMSEAIRRSIIGHRHQTIGVPTEWRKARTEALLQLFELTEGNDADAEVARIKAEDEYA